jgi:phosphoribosylglycinamide formyltransferase-1
MNLRVLASHEGTTLQSLFDAFASGRIPGRVSVVVSNNGDPGALVKAREAGVQAVHLSSSTHRDPATLDAAIRDVLVAAAVDVVFLAGYMMKLGRGARLPYTRQAACLRTDPRTCRRA